MRSARAAAAAKRTGEREQCFRFRRLHLTHPDDAKAVGQHAPALRVPGRLVVVAEEVVAAVAMAEPGDGKPLGAGVDVGGAGKWLCHVDVHVQ